MEYLVKDYGAIADGVTDAAPSIQKAIDECNKNGGGKVILSAGTYLCSTITLKSNVEFHLEMGCKIISSFDGDCYSEGHAALLEAKDAENISITGFGVIDGRSQMIFYDDGQDPLHEAPLDYPYGVFRPRTSMFENIKNLVIRDITIQNSVFWTLHFAGCNNVTVSGIKILNDTRSNENDGIDPDCCKNVVISDCIITAGDDPIVVKTTKPMAEKYGSSENIVVTNCVFKTKSAGLKIGTETWADIRNIEMSGCVMEECGRAVAIWARDGGIIENIHVSNVRATCRAYNACNDNKHIGAGYPYWWGKGEAIFITNTSRDGKNLNTGKIREITLNDLNIDSESCIFISGSDYGEISDVEIRNCKINLKKNGSQEPGRFDFRPSPKDVYNHDIPGIYIDTAKNVSVKDTRVRFLYDSDAYSNVVQTENSENVYLDGVWGNPAKENLPAVKAVNVKNFECHNLRTDAETKITQE